MGEIIDRTGEIGYNNFGSKMVIVEYRKAIDIDVYFPEYDWTFKHTRYNGFKKGNVSCPYERRVFNIGYIGEGKHKSRENDEDTKCYITWVNMLKRCYDPKLHKKHSTYKNCEVCKEWHNYTNFGDWFTDNYYEIKGQKMCLDKDILHKGNKIYSSENCVFVPQIINKLFIKSNKLRGNYPIGVYYHERDKKFKAQCNIYDFEENKSKKKFLGTYDTPQQAFKVYKQFKEQYIKQVADYYKDQIPDKLYDALYNYEVDIDD